MQRKRSWRVGLDQIEKLRTAAQRFVGTHNFHNFTIGRDASDKSNFRHIKSVEVGGELVSDKITFYYLIKIADPVTHGETEWVSVLFHGQSFMLHQVNINIIPSLVLMSYFKIVS